MGGTGASKGLRLKDETVMSAQVSTQFLFYIRRSISFPVFEEERDIKLDVSKNPHPIW